MEISINGDGSTSTIELSGALGSVVPADVEARIVKAVRPGCRIVLDLSRLEDVSAGGLRLLLMLYREVTAVGGSVSVVGVDREMVGVLDAIGFLGLARRQAAKAGLVPRVGSTSAGLRRIDVYPTHRHGDFGLRAGFPIPFGAMASEGGVNVSIYSRHATSVTLVLFERGDTVPMAEIPFPDEFRIGDVFAMFVFGIDPDRVEYGFRIDGPHDPASGDRFDASKVVLDPYAHAIGGLDVWGANRDASTPYTLRSRIVPHDFDWEGDRPLGLPVEDLVIYEMHARGFTRHPSSGVRNPGTFSAIRDKIPHLKELGVNAVELMPIFEFDEWDNPRSNPLDGSRLKNYWGYSTIGFFAPKAGYAATGKLGLQSDELKELVKELHRHGIEVILDVVFNHSAEGDERGPTLSFRGIDNKVYYMLTTEGFYRNYSGCGNTLNCNHPVVRDLVVSCLRHWVSEYHIDGFRFDLASILGRDVLGVPLPNPPLLESLAYDPVLARCKLIAEAWDAGGLYQVGSFPSYGRWAEWNGRYRDWLRRFLKGDAGQVSEGALRLMGSPDMYADRGPGASVNFVTCHDGFTLMDLVSYNDKHNEANGEESRDGENHNNSWNCGIEGPTDDPEVLELRRRQIKNALAILFLSQGVPMIGMGDEMGRTQEGNNNAYCQDSPLTWLDWSLAETNADLLRFCRMMIAFRRAHPALRHARHGGHGPAENGDWLEVTWHGISAWQPDWSFDSRTLALMLRHRAGRDTPDDVLYIALNMHWEMHGFSLPAPPPGLRWHVAINTGVETPDDIWNPNEGPMTSEPRLIYVGPRSLIVLEAR